MTEMNQCDGCRAGWPIVRGIHRSPSGCSDIGCTADRYISSNQETNRDKVLRGEVVELTDGRLREMQEQAIALEGVGYGQKHWHWAAVVNELIARRAAETKAESQLRWTEGDTRCHGTHKVRVWHGDGGPDSREEIEGCPGCPDCIESDNAKIVEAARIAHPYPDYAHRPDSYQEELTRAQNYAVAVAYAALERGAVKTTGEGS